MKITNIKFLKDVFICSLGAYGGPEAHYSIFMDQLVSRKKYLKEEELLELIALTGILPGPSSTQTIVSIGYKLGGPFLALLTMIVWAFPILIFMIIFSFLGNLNISKDIFRYIGPMAVGFIIVASYKIYKKVIKNKLDIALFILSSILTYIIKSWYIFPLIMLLGALVNIFISKEKKLWENIKIKPKWIYLIVFILIAFLSPIIFYFTNNKLVYLFNSFYRYGYLVIGGGQVVIPMMYNDLVEINKFITNDEFLIGYGLIQGLPGPMFSFSSYISSLAMKNNGIFLQVLGGLVGSLGIFLPGLLLIYFVYPIWEDLKEIKGIKIAIKGISSVPAGFVFIAAINLLEKSEINVENIFIITVTSLLLLTRKIPATLIVALTILLAMLF